MEWVSCSRRVSFFGLLLTTCFIAGCGNGEFPVRKAGGIVVCGGKPVSKGSIYFSPIGEKDVALPGKPASATVGTDGKFVLSTYGRFDGAIVGRHSVEFQTAGEEDSEDESEASEENSSPNRSSKRRDGCVQKGRIVVEVKSVGENEFEIELMSSGK